MDEAYRAGNLRNHCKLFDEDSEESLAHTFQLFYEINRHNHLTMQPKKLQYSGPGDKPVIFGGMAVSLKGVQPNPEKMAGIEEFQTPSDKEGVMRFLGAISQFRKWNPDIMASSTELRKLLTKGTVFTWGESEQKEFENLKDIMAKLKWVTPSMWI